MLEDGREFRCLINPDKTKADYDNKILSIPYEDICLNKLRRGTTTQGIEKTGIKPGDVFKWKETDTYWLVYLEYIEEDAYFRGEIRRCETTVNIYDKEYHVYIRGPVETTIQWNQKKGDMWNDLNYTLIIYITKNDETLDYFHRFARLEIDGDIWEVKTVDPYSADGIIEVVLGEWYNNTIEKEAEAARPKPIPPVHKPKDKYITGDSIVSPFDIRQYVVINAEDGEWLVDSKKALITEQDEKNATVKIMTGKSGKFNLIYRRKDNDDIILPIVIKSL